MLAAAFVGALPALGLAAAVLALAAAERAPGAAHEGRHLAVVAAVVVAAAGLCAARTAAVGATLVALAVWVLPGGPARSAVVLAVIAATLAVAVGTRLRRDAAMSTGLPLMLTIPVALALQVLLRGPLLVPLTIDAVSTVRFVLLPVLGAVATTLLARRAPPGRVAIGVATALLLGPGWNVAVVATIVTLAGVLWAEGAENAGGRAAGAAAAAAAAIVAGPAAGVAALAAGVGALRSRPQLAFLGCLAGAALLAASAGATRSTAFGAAALLPLLLPTLGVGSLTALAGAIAPLALAVAAGAANPTEAALAAPVLVAALRLDGRAVAFQGAFTGALLAATALLAAVPWARERPLGDLVALVAGTPVPSWTIALAVAAVASLTAVALARRPNLAPGLAAVAALATVVAAAPRVAATPLLPAGTVVLDGGAPRWSTAVEGSHAQRLVLDTHLANGADLAPGTPVATVTLRRGVSVVRLPLRAGLETGEWSARRNGGVIAPAAFATWFADDGELGQQYRTTLPLGTTQAAGASDEDPLVVEVTLETPTATSLALVGAELRP